jgi:hypothetical protein
VIRSVVATTQPEGLLITTLLRRLVGKDRFVGGAVVHSATSNGNNWRDLLVVREH